MFHLFHVDGTIFSPTEVLDVVYSIVGHPGYAAQDLQLCMQKLQPPLLLLRPPVLTISEHLMCLSCTQPAQIAVCVLKIMGNLSHLDQSCA